MQFNVDHIIAAIHLGTNGLDNLAWACASCNNFKSANIASYDDDRTTLVRLYHPRRDHWTEHFEMVEGAIVARSAIGRETVRVLHMNETKQIRARRLLIERGLWEVSDIDPL